MKGKLSRMWRSALSMMLALCMVIGMSPVAFATGSESVGETINYVSIGDSMANGYCFEGYEQGNGTAINFFEGTGVYGEGAYPNQFAAWLAEQGYTVNHAKLAVSALRAEDLNYLLGGREMPTDGWYDEVNGYTEVSDNAALSKYFQDSVANADIITLGVGNASFGAYMLHTVTDALGLFGASLDESEKVNLDMALAQLDSEQRQVVVKAYNQMKAKLINAIPDPALVEQYNVNEICDIVAYTAAGFLVNYKGSLEQIVKLNPDVEVILVGLMNTTYGMEITGEGMDPIPVGDIMDGFFAALNAYVAGLPAVMQAAGEWEDASFYYAEQPNPLFISQQFAALKEANWGNIDNGRLSGAIVRDRNIKAYNDSLRELIRLAMADTLVASGISVLPEINAGDLTSPRSQAHGISAAIYLGIEDAVAESTETMEIPLSGLVKIATDLTGVFADFSVDFSDIRGSLADYLTSTPELKGMCKIYALFKVGNGMSVHPTPAGHDNIAAAVINAYETNHTAKDETKENVEVALDEIYKLLEQYGPEVIEGAYSYAEEQGYVAALETAVEELKAELEAKAEHYINEAKPAIEAAIAELEAEAAALEEELAALKAELEAKKAELGEAVDEAAEAAIAELEAVIAKIDAAIAAVEGKISDIHAVIEELEAALADIESELGELAEAVAALEASVGDLIALVVESSGSSVESVLKAFEAARKVAIAAAEAVETVYEQAEVVFNDVAAMAEELGGKAAALAEYVAAELQAVCDMLPEDVKADIEQAIEDAKAEAEKQMETVKAELQPQIDALIAELEAKKAEMEAEIAAKTAELKAAAEAEIAELKAQLEAKKAELENAAEELKAEIEAEIAAIEAELAAAQAELEAAIAAVKAEIEAAYAEAIAELEAAVEELKAELEEKVAEIEAALAEKIAELEAAGEEILSAAKEIQAAVKEELAAVKAEVEAILGGAVDSAEELAAAVDALVKETLETIDAKVKEAIEAFKAAYVGATTDDYTITEDSLYVALGDGSAVSESYVDLVKAELEAEYDVELSYANLAKEGTIEDAASVIQANVATIAQADLITVGYGNNAFTKSAVTQMYNALMGYATIECDWAAYAGNEGAAYIEQALDEVYNKLVENGMDVTLPGYKASLATALTLAIESYAYGVVNYAIDLPEVVHAIREINPDAVVIIVGMYNPLDGVTIQYENVSIEIGEYIGYLVEAANLHGTAYAMLTSNAIYVEAPDAETKATGRTVDAIPFFTEYVFGQGAVLNPTEAGHAYIAEQILEALNITVDIPVEPAGLMGDADSNGVVNNIDALMILQYFVGNVAADKINLSVCDVNADGMINNIDALMVLQYFVGNLAIFPAEQ